MTLERRCLTNKPSLYPCSLSKQRVVGVTTHVQFLVQIQALELALGRAEVCLWAS